jgi:hypothetical protein
MFLRMCFAEKFFFVIASPRSKSRGIVVQTAARRDNLADDRRLEADHDSMKLNGGGLS